MKTILLVFLACIIASVSNAQWVKQTSGTTQTLYSVSATTGGGAWACGTAGTVLHSDNYGGTWNSAGSSLFAALDLYNICSLSEFTALVTGSNGTGTFVYRTSNSGANWTQVFSQTGGFMNVININPLTGKGFMEGDPVGGRWSLWKTTDYGVTWDSGGLYLQQAGSEAGWNNSGSFNGNNEFFFGTNNSRVYRTTNEGLSWSAQTTPEANSYSLFVNFDNGVGLSGGTGLMRTTNSGNNWSTQSSPGTGNVLGMTGAENKFWFVRQGESIYSSNFGGTSWITDTTVTGAQFLAMGVVLAIITDDPNGGGLYYQWAVGNTGNIYRSDFSLGITPVSSNTPERYSLSQNYPNPFNPSSKIKFDISKADFVTLKVYNTLGQEVTKLVNENLQPGTYEVTFDGAGLNSGIYFYTIKAGDFVETRKMMLVK